MNALDSTWFFPLKHKSDFKDCFIKFYKLILTQFNEKIQVTQTDGGGEFIDIGFQNYLVDNGIHHQISCPKTP